MHLLPSAVGPETIAGTHGVFPQSLPRILFAMTEREMNIFFGKAPHLPGEVGYHFTREKGWRSMLEETCPDILVTCWSTPAVPEAWLADPGCPLSYICHLTGTVRAFVPRSFLERGGIITNWGGMAAPQVAEHALLLALAALRKMPAWRPGGWNCKLTTKTLFGKRVGLHGFGQVARNLRELLRPFNARVQAFSHGVPDAFMAAHDVAPCHSLKELFSTSDVIIECEALTEASSHSVTAGILAALPDGGVFVNVGRGHVVDERALIDEASSGRIGVAIDVVAHEPLPPDSPLATLPNVIYSPHLAGPTGDRFLDCGRHALANIERYTRQLPLEAEVTLEIYDRAT